MQSLESSSRFKPRLNFLLDDIDLSELIYSLPKFQKAWYFISNFKHKNTVYLKLNTPKYCIPKNPSRPWSGSALSFQMKGLERPACRENLATKNRSFTHAYILPVSDFCQSEIKFGVHWPRTKTGEEVTVECSLVDSNLTGIIATCINRPLSLYRWRYTCWFLLFSCIVTTHFVGCIQSHITSLHCTILLIFM